jgi:hypothetical protein
MNAEFLFHEVQCAQANADAQAGLVAYPENACLLPNDAVYPLRVSNLLEVLKLACDLSAQSGKRVGVVLDTMLKNVEAVEAKYPFTSAALRFLADKYGGNA